MKMKFLLLSFLIFTSVQNSFSQSDSVMMAPPSIIKLDQLGTEYRQLNYRLRSSYNILDGSLASKVLLKNSSSIESENNSGNRVVYTYSNFISVNNEHVTNGYTLKTKGNNTFSNARLLKIGNDFLFLFDGFSETDSSLVLNENLELKNKVKLNTTGLVDAKIIGDHTFTITNDSELDESIVSVYSSKFDFLQSFHLSGQTSQVFEADGNLIAANTNSVSIISNSLELKELSLPATSWIQKGEMLLGINPDANSWLLNTNSLEQIDLGESRTSAFWSNEGYFLVSENSISKYDENHSELFSFLIPEEDGFNKPSIQFNNEFFLLSYSSAAALNNEKRFKLLNFQGEQIYSEVATVYSNNPFTPSLSKFNSGDMLLNSPTGLRKINKQGQLVWEKTFEDRNNASLLINADDSFFMLFDHASFDVLAQFENDDERCRYQAINPVPESLCSAEEATGYHQAIVQMEGNLPATLWNTYLNNYTISQPYHGLGIDFLWYKDGIVDSSQFKINYTFKDSTNYFIDLVPNSTYKVEIKQGNCALMSEEIAFGYHDNNEIMQPSITTDQDVIFKGDTVKITGNCENSSFSGDYPGPFPGSENFKYEMPLSDTTYSINCESIFPRFNTAFREELGDHFFSPGYGKCLSQTVSANVIVYDPSTVLATENETPSIKIYPNPAHNYLDIKTPENTELKGLDIINSNGNVIKSVGPTNRIKLDGYSSGIYHVRFKFADHVATRKFVIN